MSDYNFFTRPANTCTRPLKVYAVILYCKEHKEVLCTGDMILLLKCFRKNYLSFLDFTHNYEQSSGFFVPCPAYVIATQKNSLNEIVLSSSQNRCIN